MDYIYIDKSPIDGKYKIYNTFDFGLHHGGSYAVFYAHMLGLTYAQYLRMCRDMFNAELQGREGYTQACFSNKEDPKPIVELLNKAYNLIMIEREIVQKQKTVMDRKREDS